MLLSSPLARIGSSTNGPPIIVISWRQAKPILALDMYEHSYHMDFGAKAGGYVDVFMDAVRWANAMALYERYSQVV